MYIRRIFIRGFRNLAELDIELEPGVTCVVGENNTGKTNLIRAIRLALDANYSSFFRQLTEHDIHAGLTINTPQQVIISLELADYAGKENESALVGCWEVADNIARLTYRFRPKPAVREALQARERADDLELDDYQWELMGGGGTDPTDLTWDADNGSSVKFADLQAFQVVTLDALRDVEQDLRRSRVSPLERILSTSNITQAEKDAMVDILRDANRRISEREAINRAGTAIHDAYAATAGEAHPLTIKLGMADASYGAVAKSLSVLLSNDSLTDFDPSRNGLGLNNLLYISMLLQYFQARVATPKTAGQLLLVEEPEAHLHPQLQRTLYGVLGAKPFQTIVTTHSTHISSLAPLSSYVVLTNVGGTAPTASRPIHNPHLTLSERSDLERYLDATRSTLLYARKVILVEGPAEMFLIPPLVKAVMGHDLDRLGITVVPIFGTHFGPYAKLFGADGIPKKCAIIADADLPDDPAGDGFEDAVPAQTNLAALQNDHVRVFQCAVTFERALTLAGTLPMLAAAARECGFPRTAASLEAGLASLGNPAFQAAERERLLGELRTKTLAAAKRAGKARFAQVAARHVALATEVPAYIRDAFEWVINDAPDR